MYNIEQPDDFDHNDIFHYMNGMYKLDKNQYHFILDMKNKNNDYIYYVTNGIDLIPDPALDKNFKAIFYNHPKRLENFLNSIYFNLYSLQLSDIEFLSGEFNQIGIFYNINTLKADIACKGKVSAIDNNNEKDEAKDNDKEDEAKDILLDMKSRLIGLKI